MIIEVTLACLAKGMSAVVPNFVESSKAKLVSLRLSTVSEMSARLFWLVVSPAFRDIPAAEIKAIVKCMLSKNLIVQVPAMALMD